MVAVLQAGLALPAYLVPHEVRGRRKIYFACCGLIVREDCRQPNSPTSRALHVFNAVASSGIKHGLKPVFS